MMNINDKRINMEEYKDIKGYEGLYQVSNLGNVKSLKFDKERILKNQLSGSGYLQVMLYKNKKNKYFNIHQLMGLTFLGHNIDGHNIVVDHDDNNKLNNNLSNLKLVTSRVNNSKDKNRDLPTGVYRTNKYISRIRIGGINHHLGTFETETDASNAYQEKLKTINYGI